MKRFFLILIPILIASPLPAQFAIAPGVFNHSEGPFVFNGTYPCWPHLNVAESYASKTNQLFQNGDGIILQTYTPSGTSINGGSGYGYWGPFLYNGIIDGWFITLTSQSNGVTQNTQFTNWGSCHTGFGMSFTCNSTGGNLGPQYDAMISVPAGNFQLDCLSNLTEIISVYPVPGLAWGAKYRIRVEQTNGTSINAYLFNSNNILITNIYNWALPAGTVIGGYPFFHCFAHATKFLSVQVWSNQGSLICDGSFPWACVNKTNYTNLPCTSSNIVEGFFDASQNQVNANGWKTVLSPVLITNGIFTFSLNRNYGRLVGVVVSSDNYAGTNSYFVFYDNNGPYLRWKQGPGEAGNAAISTSGSVTLASNTWYSANLTVTNTTNYSFTVNGTTVNMTNTLFTSGFVGFIGLGSEMSVSNLHLARY